MGISGWIGLLLFLLHVLVCIGTYFGIKTHILHVKLYVFPVVVFVPVGGLICCLILSTQVLIQQNGTLDTGADRLKINEETYRSIFTAPEEEQKEIIPLEEVLIINDASVRRKLIMDILHDHPERYMDILMQARLNEDVEVVHYATTAMAELSKGYDKELQDLERAYEQQPDSEETLYALCDFLKQYLENGLAEGQLGVTRREQYAKLLEKRRHLEMKREEKGEQELRRLEATLEDEIRNAFALSRYSEAESLLKEMELLFADTESYLMLKAELYARQEKGEELKKQIQTMEQSGVYLSSKNRAVLGFWKGQTV